MPQGSWLGPLSFLVLIDDLSTGCPMYKYVDDSALSEVLHPNSSKSDMLNFFKKLLDWTENNDVQLNASKTKEMILGPLAKSNPPLLTTKVYKGRHYRLELPPLNFLVCISTPHLLGLPMSIILLKKLLVGSIS